MTVFNRRKYTAEGEALSKAKKIVITLHVDGTKLLEMHAPVPGLFAIVRRPDGDGFDIEVVQPQRVIDNGGSTELPASWQRDALGL